MAALERDGQRLTVPSDPPRLARTSRAKRVSGIVARVELWDAGARWQYYKDTDFGTRTSFVDREFALDGEQAWLATEQGVLRWDARTGITITR
jgi:hypothetical protein